MTEVGADTSLADTAAPLDVLLIEAALGPLRRFVPDVSTAKWVLSLARRPRTTARHLGGLVAETARITVGTSTVGPHRRDRRFADTGWTENPLLRRLVQVYLAGGRTVDQLVEDADLDPRDRKRVTFLVENLVEAASPSNVPLLNPASAKAVIDTAGLSLVRGGGRLVKDLASSPRVPEMVDTSGFTIGGNIAATPGAVVFRNEVLELVQFAPQCDEVYETPVLIVPPTINKYYAIDLAPGRSLVEFSVTHSRQMFVISWRNPDARHRDWGFDSYVTAILEALDVVQEITENDQVVLAGICSGGILAGITAAHLAATGTQDRLAGLVFAVTVIDNAGAGSISALSDPRLARLAKAKSARAGYLDGRALAEVFAWLRPGDLIWNYWVNNYLLGKRPPAFDILFWNADTTRMTAQLHADFVDVAMQNSLTTPNRLTVLGQPIDLGKVTVDSYIVAGIADHITPWENCYRTTRLLGGSSRFVLSTSGHIAALVNPPDNPKASYRTNDDHGVDATVWLEGATTHQGSWWTDVAEWLDQRCGELKPAPEELGSVHHEPIVDAPGTYVFDR
ncbi:PHA/PHB synthase family protein [Williamsia sterculiae]|uniref:Polyhydroxyalkanoate synthase n=1 Tax=Williamsia sterculiae TaxID=1344003 RepID=A0A1N7GZD1_9NOCA|nr:alpha/beta fold hydrolase [Williamsia sterculiae]SIS17886.1 polyhydroxyalkanoate synthase [Williamsia sterculiae]